MMTINKCKQCGKDYMYSDTDKRFTKICQECVSKNETVKRNEAKRKHLKTKTQIHPYQRQCIECLMWFFPSSSYRKICSPECRKKRLEHQRKENRKNIKKTFRNRLSTYKYVTKTSLKKMDVKTLFKKANQAMVRLELIDEILKSKYRTSLYILTEIKGDIKND